MYIYLYKTPLLTWWTSFSSLPLSYYCEVSYALVEDGTRAVYYYYLHFSYCGTSQLFSHSPFPPPAFSIALCSLRIPPSSFHTFYRTRHRLLCCTPTAQSQSALCVLRGPSRAWPAVPPCPWVLSADFS